VNFTDRERGNADSTQKLPGLVPAAFHTEISPGLTNLFTINILSPKRKIGRVRAPLSSDIAWEPS
jgi:hypothetical protein